jgi:adenosylcobalamin-dependent ribonucleoside-triphosphate reductase
MALNPLDVRSEIITRRTYARPVADGGQETWAQTMARVRNHQEWLWERARGFGLDMWETRELNELMGLFESRVALPAGRTLWLGGTDIAKTREASQFNCSFLRVETVHDIVDAYWLLLQGCGVGFEPVRGTLSGFARPVDSVSLVHSERSGKGGRETNSETYDPVTETYTISIGDSAMAWAKSIGKLLAAKYPAKHVVLDFSEIRPAGEVLSGYGWISSGDAQLAVAYELICKLLSRRAGQLLNRVDILDIMNLLGTTLSSRRSAEIALVPYGDSEWRSFATAKADHNTNGKWWRGQSNNSLTFEQQPSLAELRDIWENVIIPSGGSEPGLINAAEARRRAPWFTGVNPCAEILLGNRSFCNLMDINVAAPCFADSWAALERAMYLVARANYRQTCVDLRDGILQDSWHQSNQFLRLCGVGITGLVRREDLSPYDYRRLRNAATHGAYSMADELGMARPKLVTTIKPSGTVSKIMGTSEGVHRPVGKYIFNNVVFSRYSPLVNPLRAANYYVVDHPNDAEAVIIRLPVSFEDVKFGTTNGVPCNTESAVDQLNRYKYMMENYVDHNCSITVNYSVDETPDIIDWLRTNWSSYVGVSFLPRTDPTTKAADLGYAYLPQEVVDHDAYGKYVSKLHPVSFDLAGIDTQLVADDCASGACPVR